MALNLRNPNGYDGSPGTIYKQGIVRFATEAEAAAGAQDNVALTPRTGSLAIPNASTTVRGIVFLATDAEAVTGSNTTDAIVPSSLTARLAAPGAIGGTTPAAGTFTVLTAMTRLEVDGGAVTNAIGTGTLTAGTVTIANTNIAATDRIFIQRTAANASTTLGELSYTISAGASFTVTSLILGTPGSPQTGDLSSFTYVIIRQV